MKTSKHLQCNQHLFTFSWAFWLCNPFVACLSLIRFWQHGQRSISLYCPLSTLSLQLLKWHPLEFSANLRIELNQSTSQSYFSLAIFTDAQATVPRYLGTWGFLECLVGPYFWSQFREPLNKHKRTLVSWPPRLIERERETGGEWEREERYNLRKEIRARMQEKFCVRIINLIQKI